MDAILEVVRRHTVGGVEDDAQGLFGRPSVRFTPVRRAQ
jgi:hypothetical protein